jgi:hypothetical protein
MFGEVIANVMADHKILSSAIYFEPYMFENQDGSKRELFGPFAYVKGGRALALDTAGYTRKYIYEDFYVRMKSNWKTNFEHLKIYKMRPMVRYDPKGTSQIRFEYFPMRYKAPAYYDGQWSNPYVFKHIRLKIYCTGKNLMISHNVSDDFTKHLFQM